MTDRELLEAAARAAGMRVDRNAYRDEFTGLPVGREGGAGTPLYWNPLRDDGDALRLAVKLMTLGLWNPHAWKDAKIHGWNEDPYAATRRAIVRAAAAIGRAS